MDEHSSSTVEQYFDFTPNRKTITKSAINSVLIRFIVRLKGLITLPILTYLMAPEEMGTYNLISVTVGVILPLFTLNLTDGTLVFFAQEKSVHKIQRKYMTVMNSIGIWALFLTLILGLGIVFFRRDKIEFAAWVTLLVFANILFKVSIVLLATYQKTDIMLKSVFWRDLGVAVLSVLLVYLGFSYKGLLISGALGLYLVAFVMFRAVFKHIAYTFTLSLRYLKSFLKISLPLLPVFFFSWIVRSSDSYLLVYFKGSEILGKYHIVYGLCNIVLMFTFALNIFWFPVSARLWEENREKYRKAFIPAFVGFVTALCMVVLLFELNSRLIMKVIVRRAAYHEAYVIMGIIAFAFAMQVLVTLLTAPLYSNKNPKSILFSYLSGGLLNIVLNFLLIPSHGFIGAAIATAFSYLVIVLVMTILNHKIAKFKFLDKRLIYVVPSFGLLWLAIALVRDKIQYYQMLAGSAVILLIVGSIIIFIGMRKEERRFLFSLIRGFRIRDLFSQ